MCVTIGVEMLLYLLRKFFLGGKKYMIMNPEKRNEEKDDFKKTPEQKLNAWRSFFLHFISTFFFLVMFLYFFYA